MSKYIRNRQRIRIEKREWYDFLQHDISPLFRINSYDSDMAKRLATLENSSQAIQCFAANCHALTNYGYWFFLGLCWVQYTEWTNIKLWKHLFSSVRTSRDACLMKPTELRYFSDLPKDVHCYRVHRPEEQHRFADEQDWISYTLDMDTARRFAIGRGVAQIHEYIIPRKRLLCLFLRRGEYEVLCLDKRHARLCAVHEARKAA